MVEKIKAILGNENFDRIMRYYFGCTDENDFLDCAKWLKGRNLFLDMDNTLAHFSEGTVDESYLEQTLEPGFYANLKPFENIEVYYVLFLLGVNVYILTAHPNTPYAKQEKLDWLKRYLPWIPRSHIIFTLNSKEKASLAMKKLKVKTLDGVIIIDDFRLVLETWADKGGFAIKKARSYKPRPFVSFINHMDAIDVILGTFKYAENRNEMLERKGWSLE